MREPQAAKVGPAGFAEALLSQGRLAPASKPLRRKAVAGGSDRFRWIAEAIKKDAFGWLIHHPQGGWRRRQVAGGGRRLEGRVWDDAISARLELAFSDLSLELLVRLLTHSPRIPLLDPPLVRQAQERLAADSPPSGDLLALHRLCQRLFPLDRAPTPAGPVVTYQGQEPSQSSSPRPGSPLEGLAGELAELQAALRRCRALSVFSVDGKVWGTTLDPEHWPRLRAWTLDVITQAEDAKPVGQQKQAWVDLKRDALAGGRLIGLRSDDLWLVAHLEPRTRSVNVSQAENVARVERLLERVRQVQPAEQEHTRRRQFLALSPLTLAFRPQENGDLDGVGDPRQSARDRLAPLFRGDRAILLSYLDEALARAWLAEERRRRQLPAPLAQGAYAAAALGLNAYVDAARRRPDALRPLLLFFKKFLLEFGTRVPVLKAYRTQAQGLDRASQRDDFLATVAGLFAVARRVGDAAEDALSLPFVDRSEEDKVLLAEYHDTLRENRLELEAIRRELAGEIG